MFLMLIANIFGLFILFYFFWKTLKDDYQYEKIFNLATTTSIGLCLSLIINYYIPNLYWFWIILFGFFISFEISVYKQKMNFFESFQGLTIGSLSWLGTIYLYDAVKNASLHSFLAFWVTSICIALYFFFNAHYRSFTWYKSGKVGFSGILTLIIFFILRTVASLISINVFSFAGKLEVFFSGSTALLLFILLYNLARND